jgi:lysophospholipase L1-like esterase
MRQVLRVWCATLIFALAACGDGDPTKDRATSAARWATAWAAAPSDSADMLPPIQPGQVLRQFIAPLASGSQLRLRLCNRLGSSEIVLAGINLGEQAQGANLLPGSIRPLLFNGKAAVTIGAGADVLSDPLEYPVQPLRKLGISLMPALTISRMPRHYQALELPYLALGGAGLDSAEGAFLPLPLNQQHSWSLICGLEVRGGATQQTVATVGDSLTDGFIGLICPPIGDPDNVGKDQRYPDFLARRLQAAGRDDLGVANLGISGNRVVSPGFSTEHGPSLLARLDADVLSQPNLRTVILVEGINDLGLQTLADAAPLIAGLDDAVRYLQAAGVRVLLGTIPPARGFCLSALYQVAGANTPGILSGSAAVDAARMQVNEWVRTQSTADAIVDFDACLRDPGQPSYLDPSYDSGDHVHPSAAGYAAMAACVDIDQL